MQPAAQRCDSATQSHHGAAAKSALRRRSVCSLAVRHPVRSRFTPFTTLQQPPCASAAFQEAEQQPPRWQQVVRRRASEALVTTLAATVALSPLAPPPALPATDAVAVGKCLLSNCPEALAACIASPNCVQSLLCIQGCQGRPDEKECQVKCGNRFENATVKTFNSCAITDNDCVPQEVSSEKDWPPPPDSALDNSFDVSKFTGRWYITAGLNPLFDTFACQDHYFGVPKPGKLYGRINWRIPKDAGDFLARSAIQTFDQTDKKAVLFNGNNPETLHYTDTWYVIDSDLDAGEDSFALIYYKGNNDAWKGYGGATLYTKQSSLPKRLVPRLRKALGKIDRSWDDFKVTNNSCPPRPPARTPATRIERGFETGGEEVEEAEGGMAKGLRFLGRGFATVSGGKPDAVSDEVKSAQAEEAAADKYLKEEIESQYPDKD